MANDMVMIQGMKMKIIDNGDGTFSFASIAGASATVVTSRASSTALAASLVVKASAGNLYSLTIINNSAATQYFQVHDAATLPADTAVPKLVIPLLAGGVYEGQWEKGFPCTVGIVVCNSSTLATKTIGAADSFFVATYK